MNEDIKDLRNNPEKAKEFFAEIIAYSIGPVELKELQEDNEIVIIDVRTRADYEISHLPMAISIPYDELKNRLNELNKEDLHIVYCYNPYCHLGAKAAHMMAEHNLPVMELCGGFKVWAEDFRFATTS